MPESARALDPIEAVYEGLALCVLKGGGCSAPVLWESREGKQFVADNIPWTLFHQYSEAHRYEMMEAAIKRACSTFSASYATAAKALLGLGDYHRKSLKIRRNAASGDGRGGNDEAFKKTYERPMLRDVAFKLKRELEVMEASQTSQMLVPFDDFYENPSGN